VLRLLIAQGEMYGLELVERSGGELKRGTVYVTLSRMGDKGYVESRPEAEAPSDRAPRRLYYATGLGTRAFNAAQAASRAFMGLEGVWAH
jgi:PadR family transcriptional regulator, regulatory protein PadR